MFLPLEGHSIWVCVVTYINYHATKSRHLLARTLWVEKGYLENSQVPLPFLYLSLGSICYKYVEGVPKSTCFGLQASRVYWHREVAARVRKSYQAGSILRLELYESTVHQSRSWPIRWRQNKNFRLTCWKLTQQTSIHKEIRAKMKRHGSTDFISNCP